MKFLSGLPTVLTVCSSWLLPNLVVLADDRFGCNELSDIGWIVEEEKTGQKIAVGLGGRKATGKNSGEPSGKVLVAAIKTI